jgi:hypothetical protein
VLEHLKDPVAVLRRAIRFLSDGGQVMIAVPNVLERRNRIQLLMGNFEYEDAGIMDRTHLRFTWHTAVKTLIDPVPELCLESKVAEGSLPLWWLRRLVFPQQLATKPKIPAIAYLRTYQQRTSGLTKTATADSGKPSRHSPDAPATS